MGVSTVVPIGAKPPQVGNDPAFRQNAVLGGDKGAFLWFARWKIAVPGNPGLGADPVKGGYILQHVEITYKFQTLSAPKVNYVPMLRGNPELETYTDEKWWMSREANNLKIDYWEMWRVNPGQRTPVQKDTASKDFLQKLPGSGFPDGNYSKIEFNDMFAQSGISDPTPMKGTISWKGTLYYVDGMDTLPAEFKKYNIGDKAPVGAGTGMPTRGNENVILTLAESELRVSAPFNHSVSVEFHVNSFKGKTANAKRSDIIFIDP